MVDPAVLAKRARDVVGAEHVRTGPAAAPFAVDGVTPGVVASPGSEEEVSRLLAAAYELEAAVAPWGGGTKIDRKSTRLNSSHIQKSRMPSSA